MPLIHPSISMIPMQCAIQTQWVLSFLGCPMRNVVRSTGHFGPCLFCCPHWHTWCSLDLRIINSFYELEIDIDVCMNLFFKRFILSRCVVLIQAWLPYMEITTGQTRTCAPESSTRHQYYCYIVCHVSTCLEHSVRTGPASLFFLRGDAVGGG